jgi:hypothetical protein
MTRPRIPLGLESTRATLNRTICAQIGTELASARKARGLGIGDVASRLLLSNGQIRALEAVQPEAFYSAEFYAGALRKYAAFVGVQSDQIDRVLVRPEADAEADAEPRFKRGSSPAEQAAAPRPNRSLFRVVWLVATAAVVLLLATAAPRLTRSDRNAAGSAARLAGERPAAMPAGMRSLEALVSRDLPVALTRRSLYSLAAPPVVRVAAIPSPPGDRIGVISVAQSTWLFVRYRDGSTVERIVGPGQPFQLTQTPTYVAVGVADGTRVAIGTTSIDNARFTTTNGQLRISSAFLNTLTAVRP